MSENENLVEAEKLSDLVYRLRAPNPGPMTLDGTNSYLVGRGSELVVIDPGPKTESHMQSLVAAATKLNARIATILVTHGHPDHYPGAAVLNEMTGAPVAAYKDAAFPHTVNLEHGERINAGGVNFVAIFTPGHAVDHLCFFFRRRKSFIYRG